MPDQNVLNSHRWIKSSYSGGGNDCVEVAISGATIAIRDSNSTCQSLLRVSHHEWHAFLQSLDRYPPKGYDPLKTSVAHKE
jgi:hypothetical protein